MIRLTPTQKRIVECTNHTIVVNASAAAGKTRIITERVKHLLLNGADSSKIVVITFTNMAAEEMRKRIGERVEDCYIGTIHSYANYILKLNGCETDEYLQDDKYDLLFEEVKKVSYIPKVEHLILDEAQDTSAIQWEFVLDIVKPKNLVAVGDIRQELYRFRDSDVETFLKLTEREDAVQFNLSENFRNGYDILNYAKWVMKRPELPPYYEDNSIWRSELQGKVVRRPLDYDWAAQEIRSHDSYRDWFILTRSNAQLDTFMRELKKRRIPCSTFRATDLSNADLITEMNKNTVKILTYHACIAEDTLVQTSNGIKTIKEIVETSNKEELIYDGEKYNKVKEFIDNGYEEVYKITTEFGNTIRVTPDHDVCILTENGIEKRKAKDLLGTEELLLCKTIPDTTHQVSLQKLDKKSLDVRTKIYNEPDYLTPELAELIGMITADGTYNSSSIHYMKHCKECCDRFAELIKIIFGKELKVFKVNHKDVYICECSSKFILNFLKNNFDGITPKNKFISSKILEGNKDIYRSFLRGLFEDGTVHLRKKKNSEEKKFDHICLTFKNDKMKEQLQTMLFNLGIDCVFKKYKCQKNINNLQIYTDGAEKFKEIGFISKVKQNHLQLCNAKYKRKNSSINLYPIIKKFEDKLKFKDAQKTNLQRSQIITEYTIKQLYENNKKVFAQNPELQNVYDILQNYQIERIASIQKSAEKVHTYCLEMEDKNEFIQNGFLMGNCKGLENTNVMVFGARYNCVEELCCTYVAVTRAKQRLYMLSAPKRAEKKLITSWE